MKKYIIFICVVLFSINLFDIVAQNGHSINSGFINGSFPVPDLKSDTIHVIGHAHMDMNWLWPFPETVKMSQDNFRQFIAFMNEYPDFTMIQSQAAIYNIIEKLEPQLLDSVRKYVQQGRWELAGGMWTEADMNLSGSEPIARQFLIGQRYFYNNFQRTTKVGWLPDNFGHISQMPQILKLADCDYFYFHRCRPYLGTFWWVGSDSSRVLAYSNETYNGRITDNLKDEIDKIMPGYHRLLQITGIGDHGGGPTREDIEKVHLLNQTPDYPAVKFSTAENFYKACLRDMSVSRVHTGEMQYTFEGCYTSISRNKEGNRKTETALYGAELLATLRMLCGDSYPAGEIRETWEILAFNQFHDILPGSAIYETNIESAANLNHATRQANNLRDAALRKFADEINAGSDYGQPIIVFNPQPRKRTSLAEVEIFTHESPATTKLESWFDYYDSKYVQAINVGQGDVPTVMLRDPEGKPVTSQVVWGKEFPPGYRSRIKFVASDMPAGGYRVYYIDASKPGEFNETVPLKNGIFETDYFIVGFDMNNGEIIRLKDKRTGKEYVQPGKSLNTLRIYLEEPESSNAWTIGKIVGELPVLQTDSVRIVETGPVRACVEAIKHWNNSKLIQRTYIYRSYPRIDFDLDVHWFEPTEPGDTVPFLRTVFNISYPTGKFYNHVPFDVLERPANGQEVPAQYWVDVTDGQTGIALLNGSKYGHAFDQGKLTLSLIRASNYPDLYPDQGIHHIQYALYPHSGTWENQVWAEGENFNVPAFSAEFPSSSIKRGNNFRPEETSFISIAPASVVMTGIKKSEDGNEIIIRLVEVTGKETKTTITLPVQIKSARRLNLIEFPVSGVPQPAIDKNLLNITMKPKEIVTVGIKY